MNKIILIGNGFDLAHGLKTSYKDFLDYFWDKKKEKVIAEINYDDYYYTFEDEDILFRTKCNLSELSETNIINLKGYNWFHNIHEILPKESNTIYSNTELHIKNEILKNITDKSIHNWVDIENEYYILLGKCLSRKRYMAVEILNEYFSILKNQLEEYLTIQLRKNIDTSPNILTILNSIINLADEGSFNCTKDYLLFLNFNYTNTANIYICHFSNICPEKVININIHGELGKHENPIIFGYGDEIDEDYKLIEKENNNHFLENIKSIKYLETNNYKNLLSFINSDDYQIYIMGHSCGTSDRTLLNTLFEHKNCKLIKVFYHKRDDGTDNFSDVTRNMSRNFTNKALMREIVVNKTECIPL